MSAAAETLPKQERLKKLLMMTTSTNDGEALTALRMANDLLTNAGWDWARLIDGRITVVEDPFKNLTTPTATRNGSSASFNARPTTPTPPPPPPPPPRRGTVGNPISSTPNQYVSWCHPCGIEIVAFAGFIFKVTPSAPSWSGICATCNTSAFIYQHPASRKRPAKGKKSLSDLI